MTAEDFNHESTRINTNQKLLPMVAQIPSLPRRQDACATVFSTAEYTDHTKLVIEYKITEKTKGARLCLEDQPQHVLFPTTEYTDYTKLLTTKGRKEYNLLKAGLPD